MSSVTLERRLANYRAAVRPDPVATATAQRQTMAGALRLAADEVPQHPREPDERRVDQEERRPIGVDEPPRHRPSDGRRQVEPADQPRRLRGRRA